MPPTPPTSPRPVPPLGPVGPNAEAVHTGPTPTSPQPVPPAAPAAGRQNRESLSAAEHRAAVRAGEAGQTSTVAQARGTAGSTPGLVLTRDELEEMTAEDLHDLASSLEIPGRSSMSKGDLVDALVGR